MLHKTDSYMLKSDKTFNRKERNRIAKVARTFFATFA